VPLKNEFHKKSKIGEVLKIAKVLKGCDWGGEKEAIFKSK